MRSRCSAIAKSSRVTRVMGPPRMSDPAHEVDQKTRLRSIETPINRNPRSTEVPFVESIATATRARIARVHVLDNPVWHALVGPHAGVAERVGDAARYVSDVAAFCALADEPTPDAWNDLRTMVGA